MKYKTGNMEQLAMIFKGEVFEIIKWYEWPEDWSIATGTEIVEWIKTHKLYKRRIQKE